MKHVLESRISVSEPGEFSRRHVPIICDDIAKVARINSRPDLLGRNLSFVSDALSIQRKGTASDYSSFPEGIVTDGVIG